MFILRHRNAYYTGRAGDGFMSTDIREAFGYSRVEPADFKCVVLNRMGWSFEVVEVPDAQ